jgi:hypothetical protein
MAELSDDPAVKITGPKFRDVRLPEADRIEEPGSARGAAERVPGAR